MTLVALAAGWLAGIAAVALWHAPAWAPGLMLLGGAASGIRLRKPRLAALFAAMALLAFAGGLRFAGWRDRPAPAASAYVGRTVTFEGAIVSEPAQGERSAGVTAKIMRIQTRSGWITVSGRVRISLSQYASVTPGDRVRVTGKLEEPPIFDDFDYRAYLARQDVVATMYRPRLEVIRPASGIDPGAALARLRSRLDASLQRALPEPAASLAGGIAFGRDGGIPDDLYQAFRDTGLAHIVAVSGANVSVLAVLAFALLVPLLGRRWAVWPAAALVAFYVLVAGASPSVVRAGLMAAILLGGEWIGRPQAGLPALGLAVVGMTLLQPSAAADVGFQLSVAATAGIIVFEPWVLHALQTATRKGAAGAIPRFVFESGAVTLAATIATLPISWVNFGRVSLVSPLANLLVAPLVLAALPLSMATAALGLVSPFLAWALGLVVYYPVAAVIWVAATFARIPAAAVPVPPLNGSTALVALCLLAGLGWFAYRYPPDAVAEPQPTPGARWLRRLGTAATGGAAVAAFIPVSLLPIGGPGVFEMIALDIGQGDAILLRTPHGHTMLVDGGASDQLVARQLGAVLPHWQRSLDVVFMTHTDEDHVGGLPGVLRRFSVGHTWDPGTNGPGEDASEYARRARRTVVRAGDHFELDGVRVDVLWPESVGATTRDNATSLVLRVTYGETRFLLTGDLEAKEQDELIARGVARAEVLKVPHHGAKTSDPAFFDAVGAHIAVISVGADNAYGHPAPEALAALSGSVVLRTDRNGRVTVRSDGARLNFSTER